MHKIKTYLLIKIEKTTQRMQKYLFKSKKEEDKSLL